MFKNSLIDGVKRRLRSRSPALGQTSTEGSLAGAAQASGPSTNATQDAEPPASAQQTAEAHSSSVLSDTSGIYREKYGLFQIAIPTADSLAEDTGLDTNSIDIVAVHGLSGTAYGTWTHEKGNFWLEDLARDFPGARVFTYGYASEVCFTQGTGNIDTFSRSLLEALKRERKSKNDRTRPIIFICHSMGGIVVKKALVTAKIEDSLFDNIRESVAAIAFLSTPHRGSSSTDLPLILAGVANFALLGATRFLGTTRSDLIEALKKDSLGLKDISSNFRNQTINMNIASFTEQVITPPAKERVRLYVAGRESEGYKVVLAVLRDWVDDINEAENKTITSEDLACLQSLSFLEINYRRQEADQAYKNTCTWLLKHPAYTEWLDKNCELLWIQGSPGSGKSTLMSFIYEEFHRNLSLRKGVVLDYFFHGRGSILQKTRIGMFRSLLHQLYSQVHFIRPQIQMVFKEKEKYGKAGTEWEWHPAECERLFSEVIICAAQSRNITLFVDALDEAGPDGNDLASYFHELNGKLRVGNCNARICISCRKYPVIAPNVSLKVYVEKENKGDIKTYVKQKFDSEIQSHGMAVSVLDEFRELQTAVVERSQNTFQWACLVVPLVMKLCRDGQSLAYIMKELDKVPRGLDEVYEHILTNVIDIRNRHKTLLLMQWVCLAKSPLTVTDLRFAMASDDAYMDGRWQSCSNSKDFVASDERMETLITSMSGGLVESTNHQHIYYTHHPTVQFIHQSVNDFLLSGGLWLLAPHTIPTAPGDNELSSSADSIIGQGHGRLCSSCINYLTLEWVLRGYEDVSHFKRMTPFFHYARRYWIFHAERAESYGVSQKFLVQHLGLRPQPNFVYSYKRINFGRIHFRSTPTALLHIASIKNLPSVAIQILRNDPLMVNDTDSLVEILLDAEDRIGTSSKDSATEVIVTAIKRGHKQIARKLLRRADVSGNTKVAGNALIAAVKNLNSKLKDSTNTQRVTELGDDSFIRLLLQNNAHANALGDGNRTAIERVITSSVVHIGALKLLLDSGANASCSCFFTREQRQFLFFRLFFVTQQSIYDSSLYNEPREPDGTLLQVAAALTNQDNSAIVTKLLLEKGAANVNEGGIYGTALQIASARGNLSVVKLLLGKGAKVDGLEGNFLTPLQEASSCGNLAVVEFLLKNGAHINLQEHSSLSPLQFAASWQKTSLVKLLLYNEANVNAPAGEYGTALQAASRRTPRWGENQLVSQLLSNAMEPKEQQRSYSAKVRNFSESRWLEQSVETAKLLIDAGADIAGPGRLLSEMWAASIKHNAGVVELLIERGANNVEFEETLLEVRPNSIEFSDDDYSGSDDYDDENTKADEESSLAAEEESRDTKACKESWVQRCSTGVCGDGN
ncbi:hypothetical protein V493_07326 [Pseudogymnoascus sp. VKM F-4281 (FW-2241)]|nr:hypothetical protein V493_07326 [Pseudogymnoascus sp. VKM F-4281 (FW-2241)]